MHVQVALRSEAAAGRAGRDVFAIKETFDVALADLAWEVVVAAVAGIVATVMALTVCEPTSSSYASSGPLARQSVAPLIRQAAEVGSFAHAHADVRATQPTRRK